MSHLANGNYRASSGNIAPSDAVYLMVTPQKLSRSNGGCASGMNDEIARVPSVATRQITQSSACYKPSEPNVLYIVDDACRSG